MTKTNRLINNRDYPQGGGMAGAGGFERDRLKGTNVNPTTLLATDYLNHFNVVEMIIEMIPELPEYFEELIAWQPRSYREHFAHSSLRDAGLALEAYNHVPKKLRASFEELVGRLNETATRAIHSAGIALETKDPEVIAFSCAGAAGELRALIAEAGNLINGTTLRIAKPDGGSQDIVNALFDN